MVMMIIDMRIGKSVVDLEKDFMVIDHGKVVDACDCNYWGLMFVADDDTFYAMLVVGLRMWLIKGLIK